MTSMRTRRRRSDALTPQPQKVPAPSLMGAWSASPDRVATPLPVTNTRGVPFAFDRIAIHSVHIAELLGALHACKTSMDAVHPAVESALQKAAALDSEDRAFLGTPGDSAPFWNDVRAHLAPAVCEHFRAEVLHRASP
jgi:hypothetical protein